MPTEELLLIRRRKPERLNLTLCTITVSKETMKLGTSTEKQCLLAKPNSSGLVTL
jgi:hypothetical protein